MVCGEGVDRLEFSLVWQEDGKNCAAEGIGGAGADAQAAAMLLDELAGDPQAKTCAGIFFRGEEWFEDAFEMLGGNAETGIRDGDANAGARQVARVGRGACLDADGGSAGGGVEAVRKQVGENLTKLSGRTQHLSLGSGIDDERDSEADGARGVEIGDFADDGGGLEVCGNGLFAVETERLARNVGDTAEFIFSLGKEKANLLQVIGPEGDVDEVGEAFERIVDLMGDGGGEAASRGQFSARISAPSDMRRSVMSRKTRTMPIILPELSRMGAPLSSIETSVPSLAMRKV